MKPVPHTVCLLLMSILAFSAGPARAATIRVPGDQPTLQAGIDAAADGDLVMAAPGTYVETIDYLGKAITILSEGGADVTTIDGNWSGSVVTLSGGGSGETVLHGFTIQNGTGTIDLVQFEAFGGGIYCVDSSMRISNCLILENDASLFFSDLGGGIYCGNSSTTIENCTIMGNGSFDGGGIAGVSSTLTITQCAITGNEASGGGGIYVEDSSITITGSIITGNTTSGMGAGIDLYLSDSIITDCTITDNYTNPTQGEGGGVCCFASHSMAIDGCVITGNVAGGGGGIHCYNSSSIDITNCTITGNHAWGQGGGGIYAWDSSPRITSCLISGNRANYGGGFRCTWYCSPEIVNSIISGNYSNFSGGIHSSESGLTVNHCTVANNTGVESSGGLFCGYDSSAAITNSIFWGNSGPEANEIVIAYSSQGIVNYCDIQGGEEAAAVQIGSTLNWGDGNIDADPRFIGGGILHLRPGSPCVDAGVGTGVAVDIDGQPRPYGGGFDMGADELSLEPCEARIVPVTDAPILLPAICFIALGFLGIRRFGKLNK